MSRPSHAVQQRQLNDDLAALPGARWRWLFTPDPKWLAAVNTTTYREVNAVRMFVLVSVLWNGLGLAVTTYALGRCHLAPGLLGSGETAAVVRRLCEESVATARMFDFAAGMFSSYGFLLAAMATVSVGAMLGKRATDTEHVERKERAKKAPIIAPVVTAEHLAQQPTQQMTVNVGEEAVVQNGGGVPAPPALTTRAPGMDDSRTDDERGE